MFLFFRIKKPTAISVIIFILYDVLIELNTNNTTNPNQLILTVLYK